MKSGYSPPTRFLPVVGAVGRCHHFAEDHSPWAGGGGQGGAPYNHSLCLLIFIFDSSSLGAYLLSLHHLLLDFLNSAHTFKFVPLSKSP